MPRQRKPQNGGQRLWTWRVANTTTSSDLQTVYRIPTGNRKDCDVRNFEITWTTPIQVQIEWENIYRISIDTTALEWAIENMNLDLSNVTLQTVNGDISFTWNISADWTFTWTEITADSITATSWNITNLETWALNASSVDTTNINTQTITTTWNVSVWWALGVAWASTLNWNVTASWNLNVTWTTTTDWLNATTWTVNSLTSTTWTITSLTINNEATLNWNLNVAWTSTLAWVNATNINASWNLAVTWTSNFTGDVSANNLYASGNTALNNVSVAWDEIITWNLTANWATVLWSTLNVSWASTLTWSTTIGWNLAVAWNETVSWTSTVTWNAIFNADVNVAWDTTLVWDLTVNDDLSVNGTSYLKNLEINWSVDIQWTLRTTWAAVVWNWITVTGQVESDTIRTGEVVTDELRVTSWLYLSNWAEAPEFVLQSEKNQPNGIATLDENGKVDEQYLPEVFTTAKVKIVQWVFNNSNTAVVVDEDITNDAFVVVSNYQDIVWDTSETISVGQIVIVSNTVETGSFKVLIAKPLN